MTKRAISVTLDAGNLVWLKGQVGSSGLRSVSALLDRIVTAARDAGAEPARSVVGTLDISAANPDLEGADAAIRVMFDQSVRRPFVVRERPPTYGGRGGRRRG